MERLSLWAVSVYHSFCVGACRALSYCIINTCLLRMERLTKGNEDMDFVLILFLFKGVDMSQNVFLFCYQRKSGGYALVLGKTTNLRYF